MLSTSLKIASGNKYRGIIIISLTEHLGDIVACEPISYHLAAKHPRAFRVWVVNKRYRDLVLYNRNVHAIMTVDCVTEWIFLKKICNRVGKVFDLHITGKRCSKHNFVLRNAPSTGINLANYLNKGNLLQAASQAAGISGMPDYSPVFHFDRITRNRLVTGPYVVFHTMSNYEQRNWDARKWSEFTEELLLTYPRLQVVEIGLTRVITSNSDRYHDYTGKLSLQDIAHLMNLSVLFIGLESGFGHIANALKKQSIILIGDFHNFKNYMVYSGGFAKGENVHLLYYDGDLKDLEVPTVQEIAHQQLAPQFANLNSV